MRLARRALVLVLTAAPFLLPGCTATAGSPTRSGASVAAAASVTPSPGASADCAVVSVAATFAPFSIASLAAEGRSFLDGEVSEIEHAIYNTADGSRPQAFLPPQGSDVVPGSLGQILTPINVWANQVIPGDVGPGATRVAVQGGAIGCDSWSVDVAPVVEIGQRYVFVLANAYDADGRKMTSLPLVRFAWPVSANGVVATPEGAIPIEKLVQQLTSSQP